MVVQDSGEKWDFPAAVHATVSGFCYHTVILGIRAFYRRMAAGAHYPEDPIRAREKEESQT
jgi:hypothetical protein